MLNAAMQKAQTDTRLGAEKAALKNIEAIVRLEQDALRERNFSDRLADAIAAFVGSIPFVVLHVVWFLSWVIVNKGWLPFIKAFDPYPYQLLCMLVSLEGVLLSTFVLIKQNRMSQRADHRGHLDLQINLLAEKEVTKLIQMMEALSEKLGVSDRVVDAEAKELGCVTAVEDLAKTLQEKMPEG